MKSILQNPALKLHLSALVLGGFAAFLAVYDTGHAYNSTTFVDAIPPEEFMVGAAAPSARQPSAVALSASEILRTGKKFAQLNRNEKRSLYNAVIYFCNEDIDDRACSAYVNHCGKPCQMLVQHP